MAWHLFAMGKILPALAHLSALTLRGGGGMKGLDESLY